MNKKYLISIIVLAIILIGAFIILKGYKLGGLGGSKEATTTVSVFFNNSKLDPENSCNRVFPVKRIVKKSEATEKKSLELLLAGPTEIEKSQGFFTNINSGVMVQKIEVDDGVAKADFNEQLEFQVGGSCKVVAIKSQIMQTLMQFTDINNVIISIDGRTEDILQP